jgi:hypothetical protein
MKMNILILESDRIWNTALNSVFAVNSATPKRARFVPRRRFDADAGDGGRLAVGNMGWISHNQWEKSYYEQ